MANPVVLKTLFKNLEDGITRFHDQTYYLQNEQVIDVSELVQHTDVLSNYLAKADLTMSQEVFKTLFSNLKICIAEFYSEHSRLDTDGVINLLEILQDCDMLADYLARAG